MPHIRKAKPEDLRFSARNRKSEKRRRSFRILGRWGIWILLAGIGLALVAGVFIGLRTLLITDNEHFSLRKINITVYGEKSFSTEEIRQQLREIGIIEHNINLFDVSLTRVRKELLQKQVSANQVEVMRQLPGTLNIIIRQRDAVAQLLKEKGLLLDRSGLVIPRSRDPRTWELPIITGLRRGSELRPGMQLEDPLAGTARELVLLTRSTPYASMLNINLIQLDHSAQALKVYVAQRQPFREGACIVLPGDITKIKTALKRLLVIFQERKEGNQPISFVDATYKINIPVRP
ncbi:MAG: FtsQ-type POTRA domain-containing protein [Lentisphaeria bacterium]